MTKKTATKTGNKVAEDKILSNVTLKKINSKLMSTKENLESQVKDLSKQVKKLSKKSGKKSLKLLKLGPTAKGRYDLEVLRLDK
jgi:hypothetical protein